MLTPIITDQNVPRRRFPNALSACYQVRFDYVQEVSHLTTGMTLLLDDGQMSVPQVEGEYLLVNASRAHSAAVIPGRTFYAPESLNANLLPRACKVAN